MTWKLTLPDGCPPDDAHNAEEGVLFYRLIEFNSATPQDFKSYHELYPNKDYSGKKECASKSLSLYTTKEGAKNLKSIAKFRKYEAIAVIKIGTDDGVIKSKKGGRHYSWWLKSICRPLDLVASVVSVI